MGDIQSGEGKHYSQSRLWLARCRVLAKAGWAESGLIKVWRKIAVNDIKKSEVVMKIDASTTDYTGMYAALAPGGSPKGPHAGGAPLADAAASAIVTLSVSGKAAADAADVGMQPPSVVGPVNPVAPVENNPSVFLDKMLVEILSGNKIQGVSTADLQAVRESGANSDLLLKRIERAALRAGFGIERHIPLEPQTVDQTTFQARGVIRTAHGS